MKRRLFISAVHLPGVENIQADRLSRKLNDDLEWTLNVNIVKRILRCYHINPDNVVDMFASRLNNQMEKYVSLLPDPNAIAIDAFSMQWNSFFVYLFPPFSVIGQVLKKVEEDRAEAILIAPIWATQSWFPNLLKLIAMDSYILPRRTDTVQMPTDPTRVHPLPKMWLGCFRLSGDSLKTKTYQKTLSTLSQHLGGHLHKNNIGLISKNGCYFVTNSRIIHLNHL
jgi:hypothetical protein